MALDVELTGVIEFRQEAQVAIYQPLAGEATYDEAAMHIIALAAATSDLAISLGGLTTATFIYIESDQAIKVTLNGALTKYALKKLMLIDCAVTSLSVSNDGTELATIKIIMAG